MKRKTILIILIAAVLALIFASSGGFVIKHENEQKYDNLLLAYDYKNFIAEAKLTTGEMENLSNELVDMGVNAVLVKEQNLVDLKMRGDLYYELTGYYLSGLQKTNPDKVKEIRGALDIEEISPFSILITTSQEEIDSLLMDRFSRRLFEDEYKRFIIDDKFYYYIEDIKFDKPSIGFDEEMIRDLKEKGYRIILMPYNSGYKNYAYWDEYEELIKKYDIKNVVFGTGTVAGYPDNLDQIIRIFNENNVITSIIERFDQIYYIDQKGIETVLEGTDNKVTRVYFVQDYDLEKADGRRLASIWLRSVIDRNIRLIIVQQAENERLSESENHDITMEAIRIFKDDIDRYNFDRENPIEPMNNEKVPFINEIFIILLLGVLLLLYLLLLSEKHVTIKSIASAVFVIFLMALKITDVLNISSLLALCSATIIPGITSLLILMLIKTEKIKSQAAKYILMPVITVGISLIGGYLISTSLYEIEYLNNMHLFRGVKVAFLVPFILYTINFIVCYLDIRTTGRILADYAMRSVTYLTLAVLGLVGMMAFVYLARSGNSMAFLVSGIELEIRRFLEGIFFARPRFKEFLFGYPALFLAIYVYYRYKSKLVLFVLGFLFTSLCVSIVNTFSHTVSPIQVSIIRSLNGLLLGIFTSAVAILVLFVLEKVYVLLKRKFLEGSGTE